MSLCCFHVCLEQARASCCTMTPADGVTLFFQVCLEQARASCCLSSSSFWWRSSNTMTPTPRGSRFLGNFCCPPPPTWLWTGCCRGEHLAVLSPWLLGCSSELDTVKLIFQTAAGRLGMSDVFLPAWNPRAVF